MQEYAGEFEIILLCLPSDPTQFLQFLDGVFFKVLNHISIDLVTCLSKQTQPEKITR